MGLDYGSRTVGVAFTDALGITVQPAETIKRQEEHMLRSTLRRIEELMTGRDVTLIVLGRPVHMDGSEGERVEKCSIFKTKLERRLHIPVVWQDEQLTTVAADEILDESGVAAENRKKVIDQVAACLILEDYLNEHGEKHGQ
jgi:putative Holliday junction resolvase